VSGFGKGTMGGSSYLYRCWIHVVCHYLGTVGEAFEEFDGMAHCEVWAGWWAGELPVGALDGLVLGCRQAERHLPRWSVGRLVGQWAAVKAGSGSWVASWWGQSGSAAQVTPGAVAAPSQQASHTGPMVRDAY
jgi:hypothetical protein